MSSTTSTTNTPLPRLPPQSTAQLELKFPYRDKKVEAAVRALPEELKVRLRREIQLRRIAFGTPQQFELNIRKFLKKEAEKRADLGVLYRVSVRIPYESGGNGDPMAMGKFGGGEWTAHLRALTLLCVLESHELRLMSEQHEHGQQHQHEIEEKSGSNDANSNNLLLLQLQQLPVNICAVALSVLCSVDWRADLAFGSTATSTMLAHFRKIVAASSSSSSSSAAPSSSSTQVHRETALQREKAIKLQIQYCSKIIKRLSAVCMTPTLLLVSSSTAVMWDGGQQQRQQNNHKKKPSKKTPKTTLRPAVLRRLKQYCDVLRTAPRACRLDMKLAWKQIGIDGGAAIVESLVDAIDDTFYSSTSKQQPEQRAMKSCKGFFSFLSGGNRRGRRRRGDGGYNTDDDAEEGAEETSTDESSDFDDDDGRSSSSISNDDGADDGDDEDLLLGNNNSSSSSSAAMMMFAGSRRRGKQMLLPKNLQIIASVFFIADQTFVNNNNNNNNNNSSADSGASFPMTSRPTSMTSTVREEKEEEGAAASLASTVDGTKKHKRKNAAVTTAAQKSTNENRTSGEKELEEDEGTEEEEKEKRSSIMITMTTIGVDTEHVLERRLLQLLPQQRHRRTLLKTWCDAGVALALRRMCRLGPALSASVSSRHVDVDTPTLCSAHDSILIPVLLSYLISSGGSWGDGGGGNGIGDAGTSDESSTSTSTSSRGSLTIERRTQQMIIDLCMISPHALRSAGFHGGSGSGGSAGSPLSLESDLKRACRADGLYLMSLYLDKVIEVRQRCISRGMYNNNNSTSLMNMKNSSPRRRPDDHHQMSMMLTVDQMFGRSSDKRVIIVHQAQQSSSKKDGEEISEGHPDGDGVKRAKILKEEKAKKVNGAAVVGIDRTTTAPPRLSPVVIEPYTTIVERFIPALTEAIRVTPLTERRVGGIGGGRNGVGAVSADDDNAAEDDEEEEDPSERDAHTRWMELLLSAVSRVVPPPPIGPMCRNAVTDIEKSTRRVQWLLLDTSFLETFQRFQRRIRRLSRATSTTAASTSASTTTSTSTPTQQHDESESVQLQQPAVPAAHTSIMTPPQETQNKKDYFGPDHEDPYHGYHYAFVVGLLSRLSYSLVALHHHDDEPIDDADNDDDRGKEERKRGPERVSRIESRMDTWLRKCFPFAAAAAADAGEDAEAPVNTDTETAADADVDAGRTAEDATMGMIRRRTVKNTTTTPPSNNPTSISISTIFYRLFRHILTVIFKHCRSTTHYCHYHHQPACSRLSSDTLPSTTSQSATATTPFYTVRETYALHKVYGGGNNNSRISHVTRTSRDTMMHRQRKLRDALVAFFKQHGNRLRNDIITAVNASSMSPLSSSSSSPPPSKSSSSSTPQTQPQLININALELVSGAGDSGIAAAHYGGFDNVTLTEASATLVELALAPNVAAAAGAGVGMTGRTSSNSSSTSLFSSVPTTSVASFSPRGGNVKEKETKYEEQKEKGTSARHPSSTSNDNNETPLQSTETTHHTGETHHQRKVRLPKMLCAVLDVQREYQDSERYSHVGKTNKREEEGEEEEKEESSLPRQHLALLREHVTRAHNRTRAHQKTKAAPLEGNEDETVASGDQNKQDSSSGGCDGEECTDSENTTVVGGGKVVSEHIRRCLLEDGRCTYIPSGYGWGERIGATMRSTTTTTDVSPPHNHHLPIAIVGVGRSHLLHVSKEEGKGKKEEESNVSSAAAATDDPSAAATPTPFITASSSSSSFSSSDPHSNPTSSSVVVSIDQFPNQPVYLCRTCWPEAKDKGVCLSCAIHCHAGHDLEVYDNKGGEGNGGGTGGSSGGGGGDCTTTTAAAAAPAGNAKGQDDNNDKHGSSNNDNDHSTQQQQQPQQKQKQQQQQQELPPLPPMHNFQCDCRETLLCRCDTPSVATLRIPSPSPLPMPLPHPAGSSLSGEESSTEVEVRKKRLTMATLNADASFVPLPRYHAVFCADLDQLLRTNRSDYEQQQQQKLTSSGKGIISPSSPALCMTNANIPAAVHSIKTYLEPRGGICFALSLSSSSIGSSLGCCSTESPSSSPPLRDQSQSLPDPPGDEKKSFDSSEDSSEDSSSSSSYETIITRGFEADGTLEARWIDFSRLMMEVEERCDDNRDDGRRSSAEGVSSKEDPNNNQYRHEEEESPISLFAAFSSSINSAPSFYFSSFSSPVSVAAAAAASSNVDAAPLAGMRMLVCRHK